MHPQIYAKKLAIAQNKLAEQAQAVAVKFGIEPPNLTPMAVIAREPELLRLYELEAIGDFLEQLAQEPAASVLADEHFSQVYGEPPAAATEVIVKPKKA